MEATVTMPLSQYEDLLKYKEAVTNGKVLVKTRYNFRNETICLLSESELIEMQVEEIKSLIENVSKLKQRKWWQLWQ